MFYFVDVALDPVGNVSLVLQIVILFLLVLGLPFFRGQINKKNFMFHGYSTVAAIVLHTALIFVVMVPSFTGGLRRIKWAFPFRFSYGLVSCCFGYCRRSFRSPIGCCLVNSRSRTVGLWAMEKMDDAYFCGLGNIYR